VGNAKQAASYYNTKFGFEYLAYKGLETGERGVSSHAIHNDKGTVFVFSNVYQKDSCKEMNEHLINHGDGARDVALTV